MSLYVLQDLETTDDGDLVASNGDLKIASPLRTVAQAIDQVILTNKGDLFTEPSFGANLDEFYGKPNIDANHRLMEQSIYQAVNEQNLISPSDIEIDIVPIDTDEAALLVEIKGKFLNIPSTGEVTFSSEFEGLVRGYKYPFTSGRIETYND